MIYRSFHGKQISALGLGAMRLPVTADGHIDEIYPDGWHGLGLANEGKKNLPHVAQWGESMIRWIKDYLGW